MHFASKVSPKIAKIGLPYSFQHSDMKRTSPENVTPSSCLNEQAIQTLDQEKSMHFQIKSNNATCRKD